MKPTYITFGQIHVHHINGQMFNKNCVAVIEAEDAKAGRARAHELFGDKFCFSYFDTEFSIGQMKYYPHRFIMVEPEKEPGFCHADGKEIIPCTDNNFCRCRCSEPSDGATRQDCPFWRATK